VGVLHVLFGGRVGLPPVVSIDPIYDQVTVVRLGPLSLFSINVGRTLAWINGHLPPIATAVFAMNIAALGQEFFRGIAARMRAKSESAPVALTRLVGRNRRRYGGYIVHLGFSLMLLGFLGAAYRQEAEATLAPGQSFRVGAYTLRYDGPGSRRDPNRREIYANITAFRDGREYVRAAPARFIYTTHPQMPTTEVSITPGLREDLYLVMATVNQETRVAHLKAFVNPLTIWIWVGGLLLVLGVVVAMWPEAAREAALAFTPRKRDDDRPRAPATDTGLASGAAALALGLGLVLGAPDALAQNQHASGPPPVSGMSERFTPAERRLFDQLLCMCGDCERLPLATCTCDFAANTRQRMRDRLASGEAAQSIVDGYVGRYGAAALAVPPDRGHNKALYLVPIFALAAGAGLVVYLARRWTRPRTDAAAPATTPTTPNPSAYDARIEDELRALDD
jgi:cytochrome c-type biogenesis protein CcmF